MKELAALREKNSCSQGVPCWQKYRSKNAWLSVWRSCHFRKEGGPHDL